ARPVHFVVFATKRRCEAAQGRGGEGLDFFDQVRRQQLAAGYVRAREGQVESRRRAGHRFIKRQQVSAGVIDRFSQINSSPPQRVAFADGVGRALGQPGGKLAFDQAENEDGAVTARAQAV